MAEVDSRVGTVVGEVLSVRFAFSGKVSKVNITPGSRVSRGQILASLDRTVLQLELDRELKDFERIRADFEIFVKKQGPDVSDLARFEKVRQQSLLDVSVKAVELAKARLDQSDLISPANGTVISDGGLRAGLYITPGANPVDILDDSTLVFSFSANWEDLSSYPVGTGLKVRLSGIADEISGEVLPFIPPVDPKKTPQVRLRLDTDQPILPGLPGKLI